MVFGEHKLVVYSQLGFVLIIHCLIYAYGNFIFGANVPISPIIKNYMIKSMTCIVKTGISCVQIKLTT